MSKRNYQGVERTFLNCAVCHTSPVRDATDAQPRIVLGMPVNRFRVWGLQKLLFACAAAPNFSPAFVVPAIHRAFPARATQLGLPVRRVLHPLTITLLTSQSVRTPTRFDAVVRITR